MRLIRSDQLDMHGLTPAEIRRRRWQPVVRGVRTPDAGPPDLHDTCRAFASFLPPEAVFTHQTAADLRGWWTLRRPVDLPVIASVPRGLERPRRGGLYVLRQQVQHADEAAIGNGLRLTPPALTLLDLANDYSVLDLVVAMDCALHREQCQPADLDKIAGLAGIRGLPTFRRACELSDGRSESPWETVLRVLHVVCGIPVQPQFAIFDDWGNFVARADLRITGTRRLPEYDGATHRERERHAKDLVREKALSRINWERMGYIADEILRGAAVILRDGETALGWPHAPNRIKPWLRELRQSTLSVAGRDRLRTRYRRFTA